MKIKSPTAAAACLHRLVSSTEASPPAASALYRPVLGLVTTDFVSHQTPAAVSNTAIEGKRCVINEKESKSTLQKQNKQTHSTKEDRKST